MIHLSGKLYLVYEDHTKLDSDLILLNSQADDIDSDAERLSAYAGEPVSVFAKGKSMAEAITKYGKQEKVFWRDLLAEGKVKIYSDPESYTDTLCSFWKGLLPNLDVDGAWKMYKLFRDDRMYNTNAQGIWTQYESNEQLHLKYWGLSETDFKARYTSCPAFDLPDEIKQDASIELLFATYLKDNANPYASKFMEKVIKLYEAKLYGELAGLKRNFEKNLFRIGAFYTNFDYHLDGTADVQAFKDKHPEFSFIGDTVFGAQSGGIGHLESNYDLGDLIDTLMDYASKRYDLYYSNWPAGAKDFVINDDLDFAKFYKDNGRHMNVAEILSYEASNVRDGNSIFSDLGFSGKLNIPVLIEVMIAQRESNTANIDIFSLV